MPLSPERSRSKLVLAPVVLAVLSGVAWQNFGQDPLFIPSHMVSIGLAIGVPASYFFLGRQRGDTGTPLRRGAILLSTAAVPMLIANGLYLSYRSAEGAAGDIGGILIMLLGWAVLTGTAAFLTHSSSSAQELKAAR